MVFFVIGYFADPSNRAEVSCRRLRGPKRDLGKMYGVRGVSPAMVADMTLFSLLVRSQRGS